MGAWGAGVFENDDALDFVDEVLDGSFSLDEYRDYFTVEEDAGIIDAHQGSILLAMAALIRIARNEHPAGEQALAEHADTRELDLSGFIDQFEEEDIQTVRELSGMVLREASSSELYELWEESGELEEWLTESRTCLP
ncbi:MAG: DUF4259 domain-containing protein [Micrococcus sp.]|nr:DUF4259 domain-containing protein [Micrococcus sp.]